MKIKANVNIRFTVFLCAAVLLTLMGTQSFAALKPAPVNPAYLDFINKTAETAAAPVLDVRGTDKARSAGTQDSRQKAGVIPTVFDSSHIKTVGHISAGRMLAGDTELPEAFDLTAEGKVTPVRDQGQYGTCWSFATLASVESGLINTGQGRKDLSERHLAWFGYTDESESKPSFTRSVLNPSLHPVYDQGGNYIMSAALLARFTGPVNEAQCLYSEMPAAAGNDMARAGQLKNVFFLSNRDGEGNVNNSAIKTAIYSGQAVYVSFSYWDNCYDPTTFAYYCPDVRTNQMHAVTIVGWDDNFPAADFREGTRPASDGAWLVKNSWGSTWGNSGYFWLSYADANIGTAAQYSLSSLPAELYARQYSYDPLGFVNSAGIDTETLYIAAIFTADGDLRSNMPEVLKAVSTYAVDNNIAYSIEVRKNVTAGNPKSGTSAGIVRGTFTKAGYHTVPLTSDILIDKGSKFSVIIGLTSSDGYTDLAPVELAETEYSEAATAGPGETFYSADEAAWTDIYADDETASICIKAFVNEVMPTRPSNIIPVNAATGVSTVPTLVTSEFTASHNTDERIVHTATQWQVATNSGFTSGVVYDSEDDTEDLTETVVPAGKLVYGTTYYWRARHKANNGEYSDWSASTSFRTGSAPVPPESSGGGCNTGLLPMLVIAAVGLAFTGAKKR